MLLLCLLLTTLDVSAETKPECPKNSEYTTCLHCANYCTAPAHGEEKCIFDCETIEGGVDRFCNAPKCDLSTGMRCHCKPGFYETQEGDCVHKSECPEMTCARSFDVTPLMIQFTCYDEVCNRDSQREMCDGDYFKFNCDLYITIQDENEEYIGSSYGWMNSDYTKQRSYDSGIVTYDRVLQATFDNPLGLCQRKLKAVVWDHDTTNDQEQVTIDLLVDLSGPTSESVGSAIGTYDWERTGRTTMDKGRFDALFTVKLKHGIGRTGRLVKCGREENCGNNIDCCGGYVCLTHGYNQYGNMGLVKGRCVIARNRPYGQPCHNHDDCAGGRSRYCRRMHSDNSYDLGICVSRNEPPPWKRLPHKAICTTTAECGKNLCCRALPGYGTVGSMKKDQKRCHYYGHPFECIF